MFIPNRLFFLSLSRCEPVTYTDDDNNNHRGNGTLIETTRARDTSKQPVYGANTFCKIKTCFIYFFLLLFR